jgi:streptomycin 6-kinase
MIDDIKERTTENDMDAVDTDPATLEGDCARCSAAMRTNPESDASAICDRCAQSIAVRMCAAIRERDATIEHLSHAIASAIDSLVANGYGGISAFWTLPAKPDATP